jgi:hypothetical protein
VAIVTAGIHAPEITRGTGKVILLVDMQRTYTLANILAKRYRTVTCQRSAERTDNTHSGNSTTA